MHDDFGDDAGGKLVDWMMRVGQEAGAKAASDAADRLHGDTPRGGRHDRMGRVRHA